MIIISAPESLNAGSVPNLRVFVRKKRSKKTLEITTTAVEAETRDQKVRLIILKNKINSFKKILKDMQLHLSVGESLSQLNSWAVCAGLTLYFSICVVAVLFIQLTFICDLSL